MTAELLEVDGLRKNFPRPGGRAPLAAVKDVSFNLGIGQTLALVGESGSGKSTTARCVMRLLQPSAGAVRFRGRDVLRLRGRELKGLRRQMQIVFQDPKRSFDPRVRLGTSLREPFRIHGVAEGGRLAVLLERVGLSAAYLRRFPHEVSGGELQRLAIARALALDPQLIVLDEPVSALDVSVQAQITGLLKELQGSFGVSYLFIAHDMAVVRDLAHAVAVMKGGQIVEMGPTESLFTGPRHPYTRELLSASVITSVAAARASIAG